MFLHDLQLALARFRSRPGRFGVVSLILALRIGAGAALGLLGSYYLAPLVETFLLEVAPQDPWTFAGVALTLGGTSLLPRRYRPAGQDARTR